MKDYMAPMEGVTNFVFRNAYHKYYRPMDKYFTPFISAKPNKKLSFKEICEVCEEKNKGLVVIPQILTNHADDFIQTAEILSEEYGHREINLNLGCPSGTVTAKGKGAGFLAEPEKLERFLDEIYSRLSLNISIKTRVGADYEEDWEYLLKIYEKFPIYELIIHPRIRTDFYKYPIRIHTYQQAEETLSCPLCYNGDIFSVSSYQRIKDTLPSTEAFMYGRGIVGNPALLSAIRDGKKADKKVLKAFMNEIYQEYQQLLSGERNVLFRMKELWTYIAPSFEDYEKYAKKIKKAQHFSEYEAAVNHLFLEKNLKENLCQEDRETWI